MYFSELKRNIFAGFKQNFFPGLILQTFALCIVVIFYFVDDAQVVFDSISAYKADFGWRFSLTCTAIFGGVLPYLYLRSQKLIQDQSFKILMFYIVFWACKGIEVDFFYTLQALWFGNANDFSTILRKTAVDQFIYSVFWAVPSMMICFLWMESNFSFGDTLPKLNKRFWLMKIPTVIVSNWLVWIPAVSIIYSMPASLQLPLFNLVLCFFVILLTVLSKEK